MASQSIPQTNNNAAAPPRLFELLSATTGVKHLISGRSMCGFEIVFREMHADDLQVAADDLAKTLYSLLDSAGDEVERNGIGAGGSGANDGAIGMLDAATIIGSLHSAVSVEITRRKLNAEVRLEELAQGATA